MNVFWMNLDPVAGNQVSTSIQDARRIARLLGLGGVSFTANGFSVSVALNQTWASRYDASDKTTRYYTWNEELERWEPVKER